MPDQQRPLQYLGASKKTQRDLASSHRDACRLESVDFPARWKPKLEKCPMQALGMMGCIRAASAKARGLRFDWLRTFSSTATARHTRRCPMIGQTIDQAHFKPAKRYDALSRSRCISRASSMIRSAGQGSLRPPLTRVSIILRQSVAWSFTDRPPDEPYRVSKTVFRIAMGRRSYNPIASKTFIIMRLSFRLSGLWKAKWLSSIVRSNKT